MEIHPYIISIDTGTDLCSVAISHGIKVLWEEVDRVGDRRHAALLPIMIDKVLKQADIKLEKIDAICSSMGPGSYTGLRVGLSTAKGLCMALDKPLIGVSTLEALTYGLSIAPLMESSQVISMIHAGRSEVYHAVYDYNHSIISDICPLILNINSFIDRLAEGKELYLVGNGINIARTILAPHEKMHFGTSEMIASYLCFPALKKYLQGNFENIAFSVPEYIKAPIYKKYV